VLRGFKVEKLATNRLVMIGNRIVRIIVCAMVGKMGQWRWRMS
jgi:hypothetical protein